MKWLLILWFATSTQIGGYHEPTSSERECRARLPQVIAHYRAQNYVVKDSGCFPAFVVKRAGQ